MSGVEEVRWKRVLRTLTSERFIAQRQGADVAAVDVHYTGGGEVVGTVTLFAQAGWSEASVQGLLLSLDDAMLPDVDLASGGLSYTVVHGEVWGTFEASGEDEGPKAVRRGNGPG
jgi:hypothetical protein